MSKIKTTKMPEFGHCIVHSQIKPEHIKKVRTEYPEAKLLVHPECTRDVREMADMIGSTSKMYNYVKESSLKENKFIIGTEIGLLDRMKIDFPNKNFYLANDRMICYNMKKHNLELVKYVLEHPDDRNFEIKVPDEIRKRAINPINRMLEYS